MTARQNAAKVSLQQVVDRVEWLLGSRGGDEPAAELDNLPDLR